MQKTTTYLDVLPESIQSRYNFIETGSAAAIMQAVCPNEFQDVLDVMESFTLTSSLLLSPGGSRGPVPIVLDSQFGARGWIEARVDTETKTYLFPGHSASISAEHQPDLYEGNLVSRIYQRGYSIDNVKGRLALDVEWNPKDGNLDRDFAAYRAWFDAGIIAAAILVVRMQESTKRLAKTVWDTYARDHEAYRNKPQLVTYGTSTTANFEKAEQRILRGDLGTCPILVFGIGEQTWDGEPWDGLVWRWNKHLQSLELVEPCFKPSPKQEIAYEVAPLPE